MSYFPKGDWVSLNYDNSVVIEASDKEGMYGDWYSLYPSNESATAHLAPGAMIGYSINMDVQFNTTKEIMDSADTMFYINPDHNGQAQGSWYENKKNTRSSIDNHDYEYYQFQFSANSLKKFNTDKGTPGSQDAELFGVIIYNAKNKNFDYS
jgi:hypothetical protein